MKKLHSQLLKRIILKFTCSSIALVTMCFSLCCYNRVLYWVYTDLYCFIYWAIRENIAAASRPIQRINSFNIALPGRKNTDSILLEIENVCIMGCKVVVLPMALPCLHLTTKNAMWLLKWHTTKIEFNRWTKLRWFLHHLNKTPFL